MEEALIQVINEMTARKKDEGQHPTHITRVELGTEINKYLNSLHTKGRIIVGPTMNDKYIRTIKE